MNVTWFSDRLQTAYTNQPNADYPGWGEQYTIDAWGNLTNIGALLSNPNNIPPGESLNQPVSLNNQAVGYAFDPAGNQTTALDPAGGTQTFTYDADNRIASVDGNSVTYTYDGDGNRMFKNLGGTGTVYWRGPDGNTLAETDLTGIVNEEYIFFDGKRLARVDSPNGASPTMEFYLEDHLGSTSMVLPSTLSGSPLADTDYYPFGGIAGEFGTGDTNHYKFTGKERDTETNNDYFGARYYASTMARWTSPDWAEKPTAVPYASFANPQTLNLYAYVLNNPIAQLDRDGHIDCSGKNAQGAGCQAISQWNAVHDVLSTESKAAIAKSVLAGKDKVAFSNAVIKAAGKKDADPNLVVGLGTKESGINPNAINGDARGIFQISPGQQEFLKLTDEQVSSVAGAVPAVAGYLGHYTEFFGSKMGDQFGESLAIASWTMGVQHTLNVFRKSGIEGIRDVDLRDVGHHRVGPDYIDFVQAFE